MIIAFSKMIICPWSVQAGPGRPDLAITEAVAAGFHNYEIEAAMAGIHLVE